MTGALAPFSYLVKDKTWMILESATPDVDQPARWMDGREVEIMK